jgi:hypothetical protein
MLVSPLLPLMAAAACVYGYFALGTAANTDSVATAVPLQVGVYVPAKDQKYLMDLLAASHKPKYPVWQLQVVTRADGTAVVAFNLGPADSYYNGMPDIQHTILPARGSLPKGLDVAFSLPTGTRYGERQPLIDDLAIAPDSSCASWTDSRGQSHTVYFRVVRPDDFIDDIVVCSVPPIASFTAFSLSVAADVPVTSMRESVGGSSYVSVVNPVTVNAVETEVQSVYIPQDLDFAPAQAYGLTLQIPDSLTFGDLEPAAADAGQQTRRWTVAPASYVSATMQDQYRRTLLDVLQQVLLVVAGIFFGLIPAALPLAARAWSLRNLPRLSR